MTVKFTKAGTFTYYCDIHPGMKGTSRSSPRARRSRRRRPTPRPPSRRRSRAALKAANGLRRPRPRRAPSTSAPPARAASSPTLLPAHADGPGRHDGQVPDERGRPTRPTRPRSARATPRPSRRVATSASSRALVPGPAIDPRGVYPSDPPPAAGGADPDAARQRVLELRRAWTSTQRDAAAAVERR